MKLFYKMEYLQHLLNSPSDWMALQHFPESVQKEHFTQGNTAKKYNILGRVQQYLH